jgi:hypothetical protein
VNAELCAAIGPARVRLRGDEIGLGATGRALGLVGDPTPPRRPRRRRARRGPRARRRAARRRPLNVNADEAAAALAVGLGAERILFVSDVPACCSTASSRPSSADEAEAALDAALRGRHRPEARGGGARRPRRRPASIGATEVPA